MKDEVIERGDHPEWEMFVQIMEDGPHPERDLDPLDPTKTWPKDRFPSKVGRIVAEGLRMEIPREMVAAD